MAKVPDLDDFACLVAWILRLNLWFSPQGLLTMCRYRLYWSGCLEFDSQGSCNQEFDSQYSRNQEFDWQWVGNLEIVVLADFVSSRVSKLTESVNIFYRKLSGVIAFAFQVISVVFGGFILTSQELNSLRFQRILKEICWVVEAVLSSVVKGNIFTWHIWSSLLPNLPHGLVEHSGLWGWTVLVHYN